MPPGQKGVIAQIKLSNVAVRFQTKDHEKEAILNRNGLIAVLLMVALLLLAGTAVVAEEGNYGGRSAVPLLPSRGRLICR